MSNALTQHIKNGAGVVDALRDMFEILDKIATVPSKEWFEFITMMNLVYLDMASIYARDKNLDAEAVAYNACKMGLDLHSLINKVVPPPEGKFESELMRNRLLFVESLEKLEEMRREREETD